MKYLSKSLFKSCLDCRTKLYYAANSCYKNNNETDPFLQAIAEGGFQVGELAKCYYPNGIEIDSSLPIEENYKQTKQLLKRKNVIIFEGVIIFDCLMARFDILVKSGNNIQLIEVKSKSFDGGDYNEFLNSKNNTIKKDWIDYMYDIAFQKHILSKEFPKYNIESYLMLADKSKHTSVSNLNQKFLLVKDGTKNVVLKDSNLNLNDLGNQILTTVNIDKIIEVIEKYSYTEGKNFEQWISFISDSFKNNTKLVTKLGKKCHTCEFHCSDEEEMYLGVKSGKKECFLADHNVGIDKFYQPMIFDIWNYKYKDKNIKDGKFLIKDLKPIDFNKTLKTYDDVKEYFSNYKSELTVEDRQLLQVWKTNTNDNSLFVNKEALIKEFKKWVYPLHMIDFETTSVAIPFHKNMHPYEGIAFQFSHHIIYEDGKIEHYGEYINTEIGKFPNFEFVRKLKEQLGNDKGSIFRYSPHENTFLNMILIQLLESKIENVPDKNELILFIKSITHKSNAIKYDYLYIEDWVGDRDMIDLWDLLKKYYYNPYTNGSNSIKYVLPAILKVSDFLRDKYSNPIYGDDKYIKSHNYKNHTWIKFNDKGDVINPYKLLTSAFENVDDELKKTFITDDIIANGGAAMTAYAKIQFSKMSDIERNCIIKALLKYCELDTFAMVLLYEHWFDFLFGKKFVYLPDYNLININTNTSEEMTKLKVKVKDVNLPVGSGSPKQLDLFSEQEDEKLKKVLSKVKKVRPKLSKKSLKEIPAEYFLRRFKRDSTKDLERKLNSNRYSAYLKDMIKEILFLRAQTPIHAVLAIKRLKRTSTNKLKLMLASGHYTSLENEIMSQIIKVRTSRTKTKKSC